MRSSVLYGMLWAVGLAFPLAALCALVYRFPIPFSGYESGPAAMPLALGAAIFYGILGGFPALMAAGALGGAAAYSIGQPDRQRVRSLTITFAALAALTGVVLLAILDKLIGPW